MHMHAGTHDPLFVQAIADCSAYMHIANGSLQRQVLHSLNQQILVCTIASAQLKIHPTFPPFLCEVYSIDI